jgi:predicted amidohydrolase
MWKELGMKKEAVLGIMITLIVVSMLTFASNIQLVKATGWEITVVAIQPEFYYYYVNESDYTAYMTEMMEQAVVYQPDIVAFPEYIGEGLLGLQHPEINDYINSPWGWEEYCDARGIPVDWNYSYFEAANVTGTAYLNTFSSLALEYAVYVVAGSICLPDGEISGAPGHYNYNRTGTVNEVYNVAYFFDPNGNIIGTQKKVHLWGEEQLYLTPSTEEELQVFNISIRGIQVGIGIAVCYDTWFDSVGEILVQRGADIIFAVSWLDTPPRMNFDPIQLIIGSIWTRSQNQVVYGVMSCIVVEMYQWPSTGKSAITAPTQLTENKDGFINITDTFNSSTVVPGVLNFLELLKLRGEPVQEVPFWMQWWFFAISTVVVALVAVVYFFKKRKPPTPTAPASSPEGTV